MRWTRCQQATCVWVGPSHLSLYVLEQSRHLSTLPEGWGGRVHWWWVTSTSCLLIGCGALCLSPHLACCLPVCSAHLHESEDLWDWLSVPVVQSVIMVSKERNEAYNNGSEVLASVNWPGTSFILLQIGFGLLEITFSSSWWGKVNSFQAEHREILFQEMCVCVCVCVCARVHTELHAAY